MYTLCLGVGFIIDCSSTNSAEQHHRWLLVLSLQFALTSSCACLWKNKLIEIHWYRDKTAQHIKQPINHEKEHTCREQDSRWLIHVGIHPPTTSALQSASHIPAQLPQAELQDWLDISAGDNVEAPLAVTCPSFSPTEPAGVQTIIKELRSIIH